LSNFPKWVSDAATALHFYEAVLATGSIVIWHFYTVIFDPEVYPMDLAWLTGKVSADHLRHTRPSYYRRLTGKTFAEGELSPTPEGSDVAPDTMDPVDPSGSD
ncbi:MAG: hypothetical protein ABI565_11680, partial [Vicinamibacteria bacterium]